MSRIDYGDIMAGLLAVGWGCDILFPILPEVSAWQTLPVFPTCVWGTVVLVAGIGHLTTPFLWRWRWGRRLRKAFAILGVVLWGTASMTIWAAYYDHLFAYFYAA